METRIAGYSKTNHFMYRQWERGISDVELNFVLNKIEAKAGCRMLIVSRRLIGRVLQTQGKELFIKIKGRVLITCFYCDFNDYQRSHKRDCYEIVS